MLEEQPGKKDSKRRETPAGLVSPDAPPSEIRAQRRVHSRLNADRNRPLWVRDCSGGPRGHREAQGQRQKPLMAESCIAAEA